MISIDFWEQYDPAEVSTKGFALVGSESLCVTAICYLCGSTGKEPVSIANTKSLFKIYYSTIRNKMITSTLFVAVGVLSLLLRAISRVLLGTKRVERLCRANLVLSTMHNVPDLSSSIWLEAVLPALPSVLSSLVSLQIGNKRLALQPRQALHLSKLHQVQELRQRGNIRQRWQSPIVLHVLQAATTRQLLSPLSKMLQRKRL